MQLTKQHIVSKVFSVLTKKHPIHRRLILRCIPMTDHGSCSITPDEKTITISIREQDSPSEQVNYLLHEYAHALEYDRCNVHTKQWGKFHSEVYTTWTKEFP